MSAVAEPTRFDLDFWKEQSLNSTWYYNHVSEGGVIVTPVTTNLPFPGTWATGEIDFGRNGHKRTIRSRDGTFFMFYTDGGTREINYRTSNNGKLWGAEQVLDLSPGRMTGGNDDTWEMGYQDPGPASGQPESVYIFYDDRNGTFNEAARYRRGTISGATIVWGSQLTLVDDSSTEDFEFTSSPDGNQGNVSTLMHVIVHYEETPTSERKWDAFFFASSGSKTQSANGAIFASPSPTNGNISICATRGASSSTQVKYVAILNDGSAYHWTFDTGVWTAHGNFDNEAATTSGYQTSAVTVDGEPRVVAADGLNGGLIREWHWAGSITSNFPTTRSLRFGKTSQSPSITQDNNPIGRIPYVFCRDKVTQKLTQLKWNGSSWDETDLLSIVDSNMHAADVSHFTAEVAVGYDTISGFQNNINYKVISS